MTTTLICNCNRTMPLDAKALGDALGEPLQMHTLLCRREAAQFQRAIVEGDDVVVACTQEQRMFGMLSEATAGAVSPIRFVNIRETGGWSRDARRSMPKLAALLAVGGLPDPDPVPVVTYDSGGRLLVIGPLDAAERAAELLADLPDITLFALGPGEHGGPQERRRRVLTGQIKALAGWLGAFELTWSRNNPIDLDLCTRCNACLTACPEGAIGLDYQIDLTRCRSHRECVRACTAAGAIDFFRADAEEETAQFDLVLDLRDSPAFAQHAKPQGYFRWDGRDPGVLMQIRDRVGTFEKPKFFDYKQMLCAHSRNKVVGCNACIDVCSALAISGDRSLGKVTVNPNLCVGCGACTTVCPTGAMSFAYPHTTDMGTRLRTLLTTYQRAGGQGATLLLHSQEGGRRAIEALGRSASQGKAHGVPASVLPMACWHTASVGMDLWLSAIACGAAQVVVLATDEEAPQYLAALRAQMAVAQAILGGLGYPGTHLSLLTAEQTMDVQALDARLRDLGNAAPGGPKVAARFAIPREKRAALELALDHLIRHAPQTPVEIPLPSGAPGEGALFGSLAIDGNACTLCLSCVNACPSAALADNPETPQLRFIERNCVQCGLCVTTCPEDAITLVPRLLLTPERKTSRVLNEVPPYRCIRCGKPFGTVKAIEAMLDKLSVHSMFQGAALERLKMCGDCRVIDLFSSGDQARITDL